MASNGSDEAKLDFAVFANKYATTSKHPSEVGKIEFTREFLKAMVERAKEGTMPVLRVAMWNRTSKAGMDYRFFRLELDRVKPEAEEKKGDTKATDGLPW